MRFLGLSIRDKHEVILGSDSHYKGHVAGTLENVPFSI